jgi:regulator of sigma E protease
MDFWIKAAQLILSLSILITLHEFGHYFAARLFKIRIEKFYLFFDPWFALLKKKIGDTEWGIGWLPLGGYVKIAGMVDESMDKEQLAQPAKPDEFRSKPAWQRLIVMIGGVTVNVIVGFFIYILVVAAWGETRIENDQLNYGLAVNKQIRDLNLGFEDGDIITHVEGEPVENVRLVNIQLFLRGARKLEVLKPSGETKTIVLTDTINDFMWENDAIMAFEPRVPIVVDTVMPDSDAFSKGLMKGDSIVSINSQSTPFFHNLREHLAEINEETEPILVGFYRSGLFQEIEVEKDSANSSLFIRRIYCAWFLKSKMDDERLCCATSANFHIKRSIKRWWIWSDWKSFSFNMGLGGFLVEHSFYIPCISHYEYLTYSGIRWWSYRFLNL